MTILAIILALTIEQFRPLAISRINDVLAQWSRLLENRFNAGQHSHGVAAWLVGVALPSVLVLVVQALAAWSNWLLALLLDVAVLYLTMGFRQFSHHYTEIQLALRLGDLDRARQLLAEWQGRSAESLGSGDVARLAIEEALAAAHRHVFAVLLWYVLLPGPCGAVLYRVSAVLAERWRQVPEGRDDDFFKFSGQVFGIIDWLPLRCTAAAFAVVGDFEDAVYCWRNQAGEWQDRELGIVLASGAGALGVQLGRPVVEGGELNDRSELGVGDPADVDFMQSAVGLVWRAIVLWVLLLFLLGLATLVG